MLKKLVSMLLIGLVMNVAIFAGETAKEKEFAEKVKSEIAKLGTGTDARVKIKLKDGTKLKGYITEVKADSFVVMNDKTETSSEVSYSQPKQVKGNNLSQGAAFALGIGLIAGFVIVLILAGKS